jgi:hypothetical protein
MLRYLFAFLFGCSHKRTSFPMTVETGRTYVTCFDCGKELPYDWSKMEIEGRSQLPPNPGKRKE